MHLILNAHSLDCHYLPALIEHIKADMPKHWRLSLCTKPGRAANVAYDAARLSMPWCRCLSAWSECELLAGACAGWSAEPLCCWWSCTDARESWPTWQMVDRLRCGGEHVYDLTGRHCPTGFAGWRDGEGFVEPTRCSYEACDLIVGPVMLAQSMAGVLVGDCGRLPGVSSAAYTLCMRLAKRQLCGYVLPEGLSPAIARDDDRRLLSVVYAASEAGWRSRIS